jgi:hypothetical protein
MLQRGISVIEYSFGSQLGILADGVPMANPFPGMNPYIEANDRWPDFHLTFIATCREQLVTSLPSNYRARIDERVQLVDQGDRSERSYRPDTSVVRVAPEALRPGTPAMLELEPVICHRVGVETESVGFMEIHSSSGNELVTIIEVLSPTNKKEPGRSDYRAKMEQFRRAGVHLVEIDLLLDGERPEMEEPLPSGNYFTFLSRNDKFPLCAVYAWSIRRRLPSVPIPLNPSDPDISLDLSAAFETTFQRAGYDRDLRYDLPLPRTLSPADREWALSLVKSVAS